eukprot:6043492-Alexandrium_andersonii.AAC.1
MSGNPGSPLPFSPLPAAGPPGFSGDATPRAEHADEAPPPAPVAPHDSQRRALGSGAPAVFPTRHALGSTVLRAMGGAVALR